MKFSVVKSSAVVAAIFLALPAHSALIGQLTFSDPTGTVSPTETIEVWVTLTLDAASDPLNFDNSYTPDNQPYASPLALPLEGSELFGPPEPTYPFTYYDYYSGSHGRTCNDTFTAMCGAGEYDINSTAGNLPAEPTNWLSLTEDPFVLNPGESIDMLLYEITPADGSAAGTYELFSIFIALDVVGAYEEEICTAGFDEFDECLEELEYNYIELEANLFNFSTDCPDANCTFTRTVVPVPAAAWLFGSALVSMGVIRRKQDK